MLQRVNAAFLAWRRSSLGPFAVPLFRALWIAALASNVGAVIQTVGASWTMTLLAPSPQMVALVPTAAMLPIVILALPAGALADTIERRGLMLFSQVLGASAAGLLAILSFTGLVAPVSLLALTSVIGAAVALHQPAWQASLGDIVARKDLAAGVSLNVLAFNAARSVGPAIGGAIIAIASPSAAFLLNAVSFTGLIIVLLRTKLPRAERRHPPEGMLAAMTAGLRFVGMSPPLQKVFLRASLFGLGASALQSMLPLIAHTRIGGGPMVFGLLTGALGFGSLVGAVAAIQVRASLGGNAILAVATAVYAVSTLVVGFSTMIAISALFAFLAGVSWIFVFTTTRTTIQLCSPRWVVGRAVALGQVASFGCMAIGSAAWGAIAARVGIPEALAIAAGFLGATLLLTRLVPLPMIDLEDFAPRAPGQLPPPHLALDRRSGPFVISIEYVVPASQTETFVQLVTELGRVRRRNGASRWSVQQDIDQPQFWIEHIESPTWTDHVRRQDRYTVSDQKLAALAAAYRTSDTRPVRRLISRPPRANPPSVIDGKLS